MYTRATQCRRVRVLKTGQLGVDVRLEIRPTEPGGIEGPSKTSTVLHFHPYTGSEHHQFFWHAATDDTGAPDTGLLSQQDFGSLSRCHSRSAHVSSHWYLNRRVKLDLARGTEYLPRAPRSESYIPPVQLRLIDAAAKLGLSVTLS